MDVVISYISSSGPVTVFVSCWLSLYFVITFWIFLYRYFVIKEWTKREKVSLELLVSGKINTPRSALLSALLENSGSGYISRELLAIWKHQTIKNATKGIVILSIIASTSPFIGLFGTVVEILEAFRHLGGTGGVSFDIIAPVISKALIATAAGILTAIPAYTFFLIFKRATHNLADRKSVV